MDTQYRELMGAVVAVNYWGEVLAGDLLGEVLTHEDAAPWRAMLEAQRDDELRHAEQTRALLVRWGQDPLEGGAVTDFTFHDIFREFAARGVVPGLACVGENEGLSSQHFAQITRIARHVGDPEVVDLYRTILKDEVRHSQSLLAALPDNPENTATREEARERMEATMSEPYLRLYVCYPPPGRRR